MVRHGFIALFLFLASPLAAHAQSAAAANITADIRCLIASLSSGNSNDETVKTAGFLASLYYLGRLDGGAPNLDLESRMIAEIDKMTPEDVRSEAARCGSTMQARGAAFSEIGNHLVERGQKLFQQSQPPANR
ncbi:MAG TPA: hypothetical protein VEU06_09380 [Micropepsaceae bacterium]|jgi:hypothetical protein|nr:hypothetical protein [Micropepsaceae bacterium]